MVVKTKTHLLPISQCIDRSKRVDLMESLHASLTFGHCPPSDQKVGHSGPGLTVLLQLYLDPQVPPHWHRQNNHDVQRKLSV